MKEEKPESVFPQMPSLKPDWLPQFYWDELLKLQGQDLNEVRFGKVTVDFEDNLLFDDDVPTVVQSRFRLVQKVALTYEGDCTLYDVNAIDGETSKLSEAEWLIFLHGAILGEVIPIPASRAEDFVSSLQSLHRLLENLYQKGFNLPDLLSQHGSGVSVPVKGNLEPH